MADTVVLDVDGTLVDTNYQHSLAWFRALRAVDVTVPIWRVHRAVGMGGDQLVGAVAGADVEAAHGDEVRRRWKDEFDAMIDEVAVLAGADELLREIARCGHRLVLASSGKPEHVEHYLGLLDVGDSAQAWTSSADVEHTKPAPELIRVALDKVGGARAVAIGDSTWDCEAAGRAGLATVAVRTGGFGTDELHAAGAAVVYSSLAELTAAVASLPFVAPD